MLGARAWSIRSNLAVLAGGCAVAGALTAALLLFQRYGDGPLNSPARLVAAAIILLCALGLAWHRFARVATAVRSLVAPATELAHGKAVTVPPLRIAEADALGRALEAASAILLKAREDAHYDALTGLANRALFNEILTQQLAICVRSAGELSVLYITLDGFRAVNDQHGRGAGDELLQTVASRIKFRIRGSDVAARFGASEFVVLLVQSGPEDAKVVAKKLVTFLSAPFQLGAVEARVSASIGIAGWTHPDTAGTPLLERAEAAMRAARTAGGNRYVVAG